MKKLFKAKTMRGFTLIELIMVIVVSAILLLGISIPLRVVLVQGVAPEYQAVASMLAERELERISDLRFSTIVSIPATPFIAPFDDYSYSIVVNYVNGPNNLDVVTDPLVTDYKRIKIIVSHPATDNVVTTTLLTQNDF